MSESSPESSPECFFPISLSQASDLVPTFYLTSVSSSESTKRFDVRVGHPLVLLCMPWLFWLWGWDALCFDVLQKA